MDACRVFSTTYRWNTWNGIWSQLNYSFSYNGGLSCISKRKRHTAEVFTTLVSGISHLKFGNVDRNMVPHFSLPGVVGGITGAYVCTRVSGKPLSVIVGFILLFMGFIILYKFTFRSTSHFRTKNLSLKNLYL
ncbi:MAG: sulfite exporter TauE/SafE family protein [Candidatus Bathyarchaeia archaeon]